jgi:hypothetical protein
MEHFGDSYLHIDEHIGNSLGYSTGDIFREVPGDILHLKLLFGLLRYVLSYVLYGK